MAGGNSATVFTKLVQADRARKQQQELADSILGSGRRSGTPTSNTGRKPPSGPLSSRAGVSKPPTGPKASLDRPKHFNPPTGPARGRPLQRAASSSQLERRNRAITTAVNQGSGITVRGMGGMFTVIAQNFAPGTTAQDIETVLVPPESAHLLVRCQLLSESPTVIAELVFSSKETADTVISSFNNMKADGRLLYVYMKDPQPALRKAAPGRAAGYDSMDVDEGHASDDASSWSQRKRLAEPEFQDGKYGFQESRTGAQRSSSGRGGRQYERQEYGSGLVSDDLLRPYEPQYR
ncbi:hypothetical protein EJ06DRAFT_583779 [Trichodelitschia bisporula]|uniref:RRM domain-containing protein n=1 Tax=Trichodelitschia bisporula TaxID=703511 RepID=A0A6G1HRA8_9PEZI|nr:hypothetical protein EJ06DRAFT_583779 [Trichodelitschia bisporula]